MCCICHVRPVAKQSRKGTCGAVCGAKARGPRDRAQRRAALVVARQRARVVFLKRLAGKLKEEVAALDAAPTPRARAEVLARVYRKGYANGASAAYYRYAITARQSA